MPGFYEFFAGGGMAREGLGPHWSCLFANDVDARKSAAYRANWGDLELKTADVATLRSADLQGPRANLAWASFPCQDLSLAGSGAGLEGARSGAFFPFWALIEELIREGRAPDLIVLENVKGALTSRGGADFAALCARLDAGGYVFGAIIMDAALFLPQSRPRVFVIGVRKKMASASQLASSGGAVWHPAAVRNAYAALPPALQRSWIWWDMPLPMTNPARLADLMEDDVAVTWQSEAETSRLLFMMNEKNRNKVESAKRGGQRIVGCMYRRMRSEGDGVRRQRVEARFDGLAGCLRTPAGGSSRQLILVVDREQARSRLISARETARLMGLPDTYVLPSKYNEAYHLTGDGVAVPVVRHLAQHLLEPILARQAQAAA